jgi:hypothetical protein
MLYPLLTMGIYNLEMIFKTPDNLIQGFGGTILVSKWCPSEAKVREGCEQWIDSTEHAGHTLRREMRI